MRILTVDDVHDFQQMADIKDAVGDSEKYVYQNPANGRLLFGEAPEATEDFQFLVAVGGIERN